MDPERYLTEHSTELDQPWDVVQSPVTKKFLVREWQRADVACDLLSLEIRKSVKPGSSRNRSVGIAKIFEITTIVGVTVRTMGSNLWGVRKSAGPQLGVEPKLFPST